VTCDNFFVELVKKLGSSRGAGAIARKRKLIAAIMNLYA
jgi:hypothetical protein